MIYFDSGATTLQKPSQVRRAVERAMLYCASPGRGGHQPSMRAARVVFDCREAVCRLFSFDHPERVVFTFNATHALNIAIKSAMQGGGHAVISGYEHNSVVRPLVAMKAEGVTYTVAHSPLFSPEAAVKAVEGAITEQTKCVIINHVSNVFGFILPILQIDELCKERGLPLIIDASQSAGTIAINAGELQNTAFICMPGHKGLYGPQGTGVLICCKEDSLYSIMQGGTGSNSLDPEQPDFLPDMMESGTHNVPGTAGLLEGIRFVLSNEKNGILQHEKRLVKKLADGLASLDGVTVYQNSACQSGVLAFTAAGHDPEAMAEALAERDICTRAGLHCAPLAHRSANTLPDGAVRVSFSAFNNEGEVRMFLREFMKILKKF